MQKYLILTTLIFTVNSAFAYEGSWSQFVQISRIAEFTYLNGYTVSWIYTTAIANPDNCKMVEYYALPHDPNNKHWLRKVLRAKKNGEVLSFQLAGCTDKNPQIIQVASEPTLAETMAKAKKHIFDPDFLAPEPTAIFNLRELAILNENLEVVSEMIQQALEKQNSVVGADLVAYFKLQKNFLALRKRLLIPGYMYGWDGENSEENRLSDHQYVFHTRYVAAIEKLKGAKLHQVIVLTTKESEALNKRYFDLKDSHNLQGFYWVKWIMLKLKIVPYKRQIPR